MEPADKGRNQMANGADMPRARRSAKAPRAEVMTELPMVTALLVAAVIVAVVAAGGPVLDMLAGLKAMWNG